MANPGPGAPEWVDLHNIADQAVNLSGWKIDDQKEGAPFTLPEGNTISAGESKRITLPSAMLNNDGDTIRIIAPDGSDITSATFAVAARGVPLCTQPQGVAPCSIATPTATIASTPDSSMLQQLIARPSQGSTPTAQAIDKHTLARKGSQTQPYQLAGKSSRYMGIIRTPEPSHTPTALATPIPVGPSATTSTPSGSQPQSRDPIIALLFGIIAACVIFLVYSRQQKLPSTAATTGDDQEL